MDEIRVIAITPDGERAVSVSCGDKMLRVWCLRTGQCVKTFQHEQIERWTGVEISEDGQRAVARGSGRFEDGSALVVYDMDSEESLYIRVSFIDDIVMAPDGQTAISRGYMNHTFDLWDLDSGQCLKSFKGHSDWMFCLGLTPDGRRAVSGCGSVLCFWELSTGQPVLLDVQSFVFFRHNGENKKPGCISNGLHWQW